MCCFFLAPVCFALEQNSLATNPQKKIERKMRWDIWWYYLPTMASIDSRFGVYLQRLNDGLDTHRDDIGTIADRNNARMVKHPNCKKIY
jgi:hypothetical protein